jgi:hypothetical protein
MPARDVAKRLCLLLMVGELITYRVKGVDVHLKLELVQPKPGLLDLAFSASNRRVAQRCLARIAPRVGLDGFRLDLLAMWRCGCPPFSYRRIRSCDTDPRDALAFSVLCAFICLCDLRRLGFAGEELEADHMRRLNRAARRYGRARRFLVVELDRPLPGGGLRELADYEQDPQRWVPTLADFERNLDKLALGERRAILTQLEGLPREAIARKMGSTPQAVGVMLVRGRAKLRIAMAEGRPRRRAS